MDRRQTFEPSLPSSRDRGHVDLGVGSAETPLLSKSRSRLALPHEESSGTLDRLRRQFPSQVKFCASIQCGLCNDLELLEQRRVAKNSEKVHNVAVRVVQDFNVRCVLRKQYRGAPGEHLAVSYVAREVGNYPLRRSCFGAEERNRWTNAHVPASCVALHKATPIRSQQPITGDVNVETTQ
jgi:hypothetical protein